MPAEAESQQIAHNLGSDGPPADIVAEADEFGEEDAADQPDQQPDERDDEEPDDRGDAAGEQRHLRYAGTPELLGRDEVLRGRPDRQHEEYGDREPARVRRTRHCGIDDHRTRDQ